MNKCLKKTLLITLSVFALAACSTPTTMLKHKKTGQVVQCGGSSGASWAGGAIGYEIQKDKDADCVKNYEKQGFKVIEVTDAQK